MPDEKGLFQSTGRLWSARINLDELDAVLTASGNSVRNSFLHGVNLFAAKRALRWVPPNGKVVDFGCGTGRFLRFFSAHGHSVLGALRWRRAPEILLAAPESACERCATWNRLRTN